MFPVLGQTGRRTCLRLRLQSIQLRFHLKTFSSRDTFIYGDCFLVFLLLSFLFYISFLHHPNYPTLHPLDGPQFTPRNLGLLLIRFHFYISTRYT